MWNSGNPVPEGFVPGAQPGLGLNLVAEIAASYSGSVTLAPKDGGTLAEVTVAESALNH